jgi:hypothetical protein
VPRRPGALRDHQPLPAGHPDAKRHLTEAGDTDLVDQRAEERVRHPTFGDRDQIVGVAGPIRRSAVGVNRQADRRAVAGRLNHDRFAEQRPGIKMADPAERIKDHVTLERELRGRTDVLPTASPTTVGHPRTWRLHASLRRLEDGEHPRPRVVTVLLGDLEGDQLAGKSAGKERHATVRQAPDAVTAGGHARTKAHLQLACVVHLGRHRRPLPADN